jgi:hypothetical protein
MSERSERIIVTASSAHWSHHLVGDPEVVVEVMEAQ